jgi:hypothetical protein
VEFANNAFKHHYEPGYDSKQWDLMPTVDERMATVLDEYIPDREDLPLRPFTAVDVDVTDGTGYLQTRTDKTPSVKWLDWRWDEHPAPPEDERVSVYDKRDAGAIKEARMKRALAKDQASEVGAEPHEQ